MLTSSPHRVHAFSAWQAWPLCADESPLNDLDEAESDTEDQLQEALEELLDRVDQPAPFADPGTP
jgi:hypothetical protein